MKRFCAGLTLFLLSIKFCIKAISNILPDKTMTVFVSSSNISLSEWSMLNFGVLIYRNDMNLHLARFWIHNSCVLSRCSQVTVFARGRCFQNELQIAQRLPSIMNESNTSQYITKLFCFPVLAFEPLLSQCF